MKLVSQALLDKRIKICKTCPLFTKAGICSKDLYLNPKTEDVSSNPLNGYIRGCGCKIFIKAKWKESKCPSGKW